MKSLLWREYRVNGQVLIAGVVLFLLPYIFAIMISLWPTGPPTNMAEGMAIAAIYSYGMSQLTLACLGGNTFAGERADRSAEFMAYLPISKKSRLLSKLSLPAIVTVLIWTINLLVIWSVKNHLSSKVELPQDFLIVRYVAITGFVMFGVGWFISSLQSSPSIAVLCGIATPLVTIVGLASIFALGEEFAPQTFNYKANSDFVSTGYISISLALGILGFAVGTWCFLKRVEP